MSDVLALKYRPAKLDDVVGQSAAVRVLSKLQKSRFSQQFMLVGPSGCGKTTLARIAARMIGCNAGDVYEHDAANLSGADDVRAIIDLAKYKPFGKGVNKAIIVDECHAMSAQAWKVLLKPIEEPPSFLTWFLCTTEMHKVPATIQTRCTKVLVKEVSNEILTELVTNVARVEGIKLATGVTSVVVKEAKGSPRAALVNLAACSEARNKNEAIELLHAALDDDATLELCRFIAKGGGSWIKAMSLVEQLKEKDPDSVRRAVCAYLGKVALGANTDDGAIAVLQKIDAFAEWRPGVDNATALVMSIGRAMFS